MDNEPFVSGRDAARLKDLAERLLDYDYEVDSDTERPRLFLGELPEDLPARIHVPEDMTLLGGLRRKDPWRSGVDAEVILETGMPPEAARESLRAHLADSQWSEKRWPLAERGGFLSTGPKPSPLVFCLSERGPALFVSCHLRREVGRTEVRIRLESSRRDSPCSDEYERYDYHERSVILALFAPEGIAQVSGGGGRGSGSEESSASLRTDLPPFALVEHYSTQLLEGGWTQVGRGGEGPTAYSSWTFEDGGDDWVGMLVALSPPGASEVCSLQVSASTVPEDLR